MATLRDDIHFSSTAFGTDVSFVSTWGIFSPKQIDKGSALLLQTLSLSQDEHILDIGCGYGALGVSIAKAYPKTRVQMVDKDFVAVDYALKNIARNNLHNAAAYLSNGLSMVSHDARFDLVISNVPAKVGKEMYQIMLEDIDERLKPGGRIVIVCVSGLKDYFKRVFKERFSEVKKLTQGSGYVVIEARK